MRISTATLRESGINNMLFRQIEMNKSQEEMSSGLKLRNPSDNPSAMANTLDFKASIAMNSRFEQNISAVQLRLNNEDSALDSATNILDRVRELTVTGLNASYNGSDREALGREIHEMTQALMDVANTKDHNDKYIFSGSKSGDKPFDYDPKSATPTITYRGDKYQPKIQVGSGIYVESSHNGFSIFEDVPTADTTVTAAIPSTASTATDTTTTDVATGTDVAAGTDATGTDTTVTDVATGTDTAVAGATGDTGVATSTTATATPTRSIFNTLLKLEKAFSDGQLPDSEINSIASAALKDIDSGLVSISNTRVEIGARLNMLDQQQNILEKFTLDSKQNLSDLQDADYAEVISQFNLHQTALQASQQAYMKVQSLSLFNYL